jgi:pimeloyl-ACP methyl ester carboxylesterase
LSKFIREGSKSTVTLILVLLVLLSLLIIGALYQGLGSWIDNKRFPPPGRMVDLGSSSLHLNRQGSGQPVVVLEAGIAATSISWSLVQTGVAQFTTVCSYDRAGLGWSKLRSCPCTLEQMLLELDALLREEDLVAPFILVGHSFGGLLVSAFARTWPRRVAGLILVDPVSLTDWGSGSRINADQIRAGVSLSRRGALLARLGVVRAALSALNAGGRWFPSHIARAAARQGTGLMENLAREVAKLPRELHSLVRAHWSRPKSFLAMAEYLEALPACAAATMTMPVPPNIPVTILSAGNATADELRERDAWAARSEHGRHVKVPGTGHWLQLERPELVVASILEMIEPSVRAK